MEFRALLAIEVADEMEFCDALLELCGKYTQKRYFWVQQIGELPTLEDMKK